MTKAVDIQAELAGRPFLKDRTKDSDAGEAFAELARFGEGGIFAGSFSGDSAWERHRQGDELVHILSGAAQLTLMTDSGAQTLELKAGMLTVVPRGTWHRFHAPDGVTLLTATPQPTDHSLADDPRDEDG
ncbi:MAG: cupin domain-containing protein [Kiloniellales bacterium]|nr:cupin domain-containing protein [Kiloniellales bacterium]